MADNTSVAARARWVRPRLAADLRADWRRSLVQDRGRPARLLAWAETPEGVAIGSVAVLSVAMISGGEPSGGRADRWQHTDWDQIERGGWDTATSRLHWQVYGGTDASVELLSEGHLPEVFRERVAASLVVEQYVPWRGSQGITVSGRRHLGDPGGPLQWHASLTAGLSERTPGVAEARSAALDRVRAEYDIG